MNSLNWSTAHRNRITSHPCLVTSGVMPTTMRVAVWSRTFVIRLTYLHSTTTSLITSPLWWTFSRLGGSHGLHTTSGNLVQLSRLPEDTPTLRTPGTLNSRVSLLWLPWEALAPNTPDIFDSIPLQALSKDLCIIKLGYWVPV